MRRAIVTAVMLGAIFARPAAASPPDASAIVARAREEVSRHVRYDRGYERMAYPGGDVDPSRGACADVVVRSARAVGVDLQKLVHEDIVGHRDAYPAIETPDASIDHRRVVVLRRYFERHALKLPRGLGSEAERASFRPGDVVVWQFGECAGLCPRHTGIVSDRAGERGLPLILHNIGPAAAEEDVLDAWKIVGHYRLRR